MKTMAFVFISLLLLVAIAFWWKKENDYQFQYASISPDGNFILDVYKKKQSVAMPGQGSDALCKLILRNKTKKIIGSVSNERDCSIMLHDVDIEWQLQEGYVRYGVARRINLKTGRCQD